MARQMQTPVQFSRTIRTDRGVLMSSGRAGVVQAIAYIPVLRGDSASGKVGVDFELAHMPKPLLNAVMANVQAWYVPKSAHPQFSGYDEFVASYQGQQIKALGEADRDAPPFFHVYGNNATRDAVAASKILKGLGVHTPTGTEEINVDLIDAYNLIYNFRLAAHSSKLSRKSYIKENAASAVTLGRAFWPTGRHSRYVPDYERALVIGAMDLDVIAGYLPVWSADLQNQTNINTGLPPGFFPINDEAPPIVDGDRNWTGKIWAEMAGQTLTSSLAEIDKARELTAFAKLRAAYAGNDYSGYDNDDAIVAELMQGFSHLSDQMRERPVLLDSKRVTFGMVERFSSDANALETSISRGRASATLSLNLPVQEAGGIIMVTAEVIPERLDERASDEWMLKTSPDQLPDALRDVLRPEPVDTVQNRRLDMKHTSPGAAYGFEPMNDQWNREYIRLGGEYWQQTPGSGWTEKRSALWQTSIVNPTFTADHYLAPVNFPHDVFSDTLADAFDVVVRHDVAIAGLTQIGDVLVENNDDYVAVQAESEEE